MLAWYHRRLIEQIEDFGHDVTVRRDQNGSHRLRINGSKELSVEQAVARIERMIADRRTMADPRG